MILKLRTVDEGWVFYECDKIKVRTLTKEQYGFGVEINTPDRKEVNLDIMEKDGNRASVIRVSNLQKETIIYTTEVAYLLNDDGKTIEKLTCS